jgi:NAD-dependent dihydropyrimidine dehydrogenase PreA subunit
VAVGLFAALLLAAHFLRDGAVGLASVCLLAPLLLFSRRRWVVHVATAMLAAGAGIWLHTTFLLAGDRMLTGQPCVRLALILVTVAAVTGLAALGFQGETAQQRSSKSSRSAVVSASAFLLTGLSLAIVQSMIDPPFLLAERFMKGAGWVEILALSTYAAWITEKLHDSGRSAVWRARIWVLFSVVFFTQLGLGLVGFERFLMTGELHLPVPALILAGPIYRGEGFFMLGLLAATVALVGPAWCSHLCYVGAWDHLAASSRKRPAELPRWREWLRLGFALLIVGTAAALRAAGVPGTVAVIVAAIFGLLGVALMLTWSRRTGAMTHCTTYCPVGLVAVWAGRLNPFRIRISDDCTACGGCSRVCRYDALGEEDIKRRRPAISCTLCGDCVGKCPQTQMEYRCGPLRGEAARALFLVLIVSLHAMFLGVARI